MNLNSVDLNLLVYLDALLRERHVTRAAQQVGLSQPAMSRALARLRTLLHDDLLTKTPYGMAATPLGEELAPRVRRILSQIEATLERVQPFDPEHSHAILRLSMDSWSQCMIAAPLMLDVRHLAPHMKLHCASSKNSPHAHAHIGFERFLTEPKKPTWTLGHIPLVLLTKKGAPPAHTLVHLGQPHELEALTHTQAFQTHRILGTVSDSNTLAHLLKADELLGAILPLPLAEAIAQRAPQSLETKSISGHLDDKMNVTWCIWWAGDAHDGAALEWICMRALEHAL